MIAQKRVDENGNTQYKVLASRGTRYWVGSESGLDAALEAGEVKEGTVADTFVEYPYDQITALLKSIAPVGSLICMAAGTTAPKGYLVCDGATFDETIYPELYTFLGSNTLPDYRNKAIFGAGTDVGVGEATVGKLPNITGSNGQMVYHGASGALYASGTAWTVVANQGGAAYIGSGGINASRSSAIYQSTDHVVPASIGALICIRAVSL